MERKDEEECLELKVTEWVAHKFIFGVVFAMLIASGTLAVLYGPKDNVLVFYAWMGIYAVLVYLVLFVFVKVFFGVGSKVDVP